MLISSITYWVIVAVLIVAIGGTSYVLSKKRNNKLIQTAGLAVIILIAVFNKYIFPNIYFVKDCKTVNTEVMLFPKTIATGVALNYGRHCYIINESKSPLRIETIYYGNASAEKSPEKDFNEIVASGAGKKFNTTVIDYFFKSEVGSVKTKSKGAIKYKVNCE